MQAAMASARASQAPVARHKTIIAAFERQTKGKVCPACEKVIPLGVYRSHFNTCKAKIDEDECMITKIVTVEEKIGPPIVLDDDQTVNVGASTSTVQVGQRRRRSTRIAISYDEERDEKPVITKRMRMRMTMQTKEEVEQMETEKEPVRTREDMILQESGTIEDEEPPAIPKEEPEAVPEATEAEPDEPMSIEEENPPDDNTKLTETAQDNQQNVTHSGNLYEMIMNMDDTKLSSRSEEVAAPAAVVVAVEVKKTAVAKDEKEEEEVDRSESQAGVLQQKYFVSLVEKMIKKVIHSPGSLYGPSFWKDDYSIFKSFEALPSSDKQLLMRLFLRRAKWFTFIQLKERYSEYTAIKSILHNLVQKGLLEGGAKCITFDEICASVDLATLRKVAKTYQRDITLPKPQLIEALKKFAASQCDLFGRARGHEQGIVKMLLKECGDCFRVAERMKIAFKALFTLFSPTEMNSSLVIDDPKKNLESQLLYTLLTHKNQTTKFVAPADCSSLIYIFYTYTELKKYIEAKELEIQIIFELFTNKLEVIEDREKEVRTLLYKQISNDEDLPPSVKRFTSKHVLIRVLSHLATAYEKKKMHSYAVNLHRLLLENRNMQGYCSDSRGEWWTRLALNLEFHLKEPEEALKALEDGMADKCVLERDLVVLQDRALKLSKGQFAVRIQVEEPDEKTISAEVIRKNLGGTRQNRFIRKRSDGTVVQCSVEEIARRHYLEKENFTYGVHSEGAIWHTVYGLFFFDIIFDHSQEGVWFSHIQTHPVDLNYPEFYTRRKSAFQDRLEWLMNAPEDGLKSKIDESWKMRDVANTEIDWNLFYDPDECLEFCLSCPRKVLCAVFQRLMKDYRNARSGFPDLTLWNPLTRTVVVSEVKGPGDRLSSKQRLWLQFFTKWGLRAEVCYVKADRILNI